MTALWQLTASALSERLGRGEVSAVEVTRAHLARIDEVEPRLGAFTARFGEESLADAARADLERRRGEVRGPLHGVPVTIKECFDVRGQATTLGISAWKTRVAERDAAMVTLLRKAGAVILGRTNLSQTMLFVESRNPLFGQTANPFSTAHTPGGSSGGEAAAIASGMSPLGLGSDIGGSIRTPCHFAGICGLKPTLDRLPSRGQRGVLAGQEIVRSVPGPMARVVADLTLFLGALEPRAMTAEDGRVPPLPWGDPLAVEVRNLRVGVYTDDGVLAPSLACARATKRAAEALKARGCEVVPFAPPGVPEAIDDYLAALSADGARTAIAALGAGEVDSVLRPLVRFARLPSAVRRGLGHAAALAGEKRVSRMLLAMGEKPVAEVWRLTDALRSYRVRLLDAMDAARIDLLVCPPYATPALPHGMSKNFTLASSYSMLFNLTQLPAGVVPITRVRAEEAERKDAKDSVERHAREVDRASAGLPVGVQVVGRPWEDATVLAAMAAIEAEVAADEGFPRTPVG